MRLENLSIGQFFDERSLQFVREGEMLQDADMSIWASENDNLDRCVFWAWPSQTEWGWQQLKFLFLTCQLVGRAEGKVVDITGVVTNDIKVMHTRIVSILHEGHWKASQIKRTWRYLWKNKWGNGSTCQSIHYFLQLLIGHVFSLEGHADGIGRTAHQILQRNTLNIG